MNYFDLFVFLACPVLVASSVWMARCAGKRRQLFRIVGRVLASVIVTCCILFVGILIISELKTISSFPIFSPDRKYALRVDYADNEALGGTTFVMLYSNYAFRSDVIFSQEGRTVHPENVRWISASEIAIPYSSESPFYIPQVCSGSTVIKVLIADN